MKARVYNKNIVLVLAASFFYMSSPMLVTPLITGFSESLGANGFFMGIIGGLMNICSLFCRPLVGNLADKISKYKLSFAGSALMTVACIGYTVAQAPGALVIARIINGLGYACCSVCMTTWMANMLPQNKIGSGMGIFGTMNALSMAAAPAIGVSIYQSLGYRKAFIVAAAFAAVVMIIIQFVGDKGSPESTVTPRSRKLQFLDKNVIPVALIVMLFAIPYCATQSFLVRYIETKELSVSATLFFLPYAIALLVLRMSLRSLFDKVDYKVFIFAGAACAAISMLFLAFIKGNITMIAAAVFMAGGYGVMCSVSQSTAISLAGKGHRGLSNSTYYVGLDLGMALGPIIGGVLYGNLPIDMFYPALLITVPLSIAVYFLLLKHR